MSSLWFRKNATQRFTWSGSAGSRGMYRDTVFSEMMKPSFVSSAWIRGAPQPSCAMSRMSRRISASTRGRPGCRRWEILAQYRRNRARFHSATVPALTMTRRLAHAGHDSRSATQRARSTSSSGGRGRSFFSTITCCLKSEVFEHKVGPAPTHRPQRTAPRETTKMSTRSMAAKFRLLRRGTQAGCKSLISQADEY